jgi:four helix bundle protein
VIFDFGFSNLDFMNEAELKERTKAFSLRVRELVDALPEKRSARVPAHQLARSGTSVGADYRAACRSLSTGEMISQLAVVEEEADESAFWLELIGEHGLMAPATLAPSRQEADEFTAIMVASRRTPGARNRKSGVETRK